MMLLKPETVGFVRGGMLFLEPPHYWRTWQRDIWKCCARPEREMWVCTNCGGPVLVDRRPNFCPYCRCASLAPIAELGR